MVRKSEYEEMDPFTIILAETIRRGLQENGMTQTKLGEKIGRTQAYVSPRYRGLLPWTTKDINLIAQVLGFANGFALIDEARGVTKEGR